jgi:hypothetical protein
VSTPLAIAVVWAFAPILAVLAIFGLCDWIDRRRQREDERRLELILLEQCWEAEAYDWRRG